MRSTRVSDPVPVHADRSGPQLARRLLSLTGIFPLGAFLLVHLVVNARALRGEAAFTRAAGALERFPAIALVEAALVFVPLLVHGGVGLWLVATRAPLAASTPYPRPVAVAMRATGVLALAFLAMHLPELRLRALGPAPGAGELLTLLSADLSSTWHGVPWRGIGYLLGTGVVTFHFVAGLWGAFARSRRGTLASARRVAAWAAAALGATMWLLFVDVVVLHATGARLFGSPAPDARSTEPCPAPSADAH
jgi:succinate dehydrogenase / fumarate reductase cytochrome b subunit